MAKLVLFMADGFEEIEGLTVVDVLRRGGVEVTTVSIMEHRVVESSHGVKIYADAMYADVDFSAYDGLVLPGGMPGTTNLMGHDGVNEQIRAYAAAGKLVAAICAAPTVLGQAGLLKNIPATCFPGCEDKLNAAQYTQTQVEHHGNIITGQAMGAAIPFALEILKTVAGQQSAEKVASSIVFKG